MRDIKDDDFSYTGPREQFARDYPVKGPTSRDTYPRRERPLSVMEIPEHKLPPPRRDTGPALAPSRGSDRLEPSRRPVYDDIDRPSDLPSRRLSVRQPVVHQSRDDAYGPVSTRDEPERLATISRHRYHEEEPPVVKSRQRELDTHVEREKEREKEYRRERDREPEYRERDRDREKDRDREARDRDREKDRERDRERDKERARPVDKPRRRDDDRSHRPNDESPERPSTTKLAATGLASAAAAGLATSVLKSKKPDEASDSDERKERRHRHKHRERYEDDVVAEDPDPKVERRGKDHKREEIDAQDGPSARRDAVPDAQDEDSDRRRHRRRHHHDEHEREAPDAGATLPSNGRLAPPGDARGDGEHGSDSDHRRRRHRSKSRSRQPEESDKLERTISPGEDEDDRPRRVQLVEPVEKKEDARPRGILKPPRAVPFPEDPNPTREGVAPLKDAGKQGIPPGARWTKISRMLVNPEALERAHERFEEREDYVIVLRVVSKEEITKLAEKTNEIRGKIKPFPTLLVVRY
jgi:zinc finger CCCH domain-containing protein 13